MVVGAPVISSAIRKEKVSPSSPACLAAEQFLIRARGLLEGYFARPSLRRLTLLSRFIRRYLSDLWHVDWMRDEVHRRSVRRRYVRVPTANGGAAAVITFFDRYDEKVALLEIRFAPDGSKAPGHYFCFWDRA